MSYIEEDQLKACLIFFKFVKIINKVQTNNTYIIISEVPKNKIVNILCSQRKLVYLSVYHRLIFYNAI